MADLCRLPFRPGRVRRRPGGDRGPLDRGRTAALARSLFERAVADTLSDEAPRILGEDVTGRFAERAGRTDWSAAAIGEAAFSESPAVLFSSAPIADELKQYDEEIVTNSIRFRWRDIRDQLRSRLDGAAVCRDWLDRSEKMPD